MRVTIAVKWGKKPKTKCEHIKEKLKNWNLGEEVKSVEVAGRKRKTLVSFCCLKAFCGEKCTFGTFFIKKLMAQSSQEIQFYNFQAVFCCKFFLPLGFCCSFRLCQAGGIGAVNLWFCSLCVQEGGKETKEKQELALIFFSLFNL